MYKLTTALSKYGDERAPKVQEFDNQKLLDEAYDELVNAIDSYEHYQSLVEEPYHKWYIVVSTSDGRTYQGQIDL